MSDNSSSSLKDLYYNPATGFLSASKLYHKAIANGLKVSQKQVQKFVSKQLAAQLTHQVKKPTIYNSINATGPRSNFQLDILIYDRYTFHNYKYILVVIDVYSRYSCGVPLTNRNMSTIITAVKECFAKMGTPENLNCDNEFNTNEFNQLMKDDNVHVWYSDPDEINKNDIVERFNRTLALLLQRWRVGSNSYDWPKILPKIFDNYNHTFHRSIGFTPSEVFSGEKLSKQPKVYLLPVFKIGDQVRIKKQLKVFGKGDRLTFSKDIYLVTEVKNNRIQLKDLNSNQIVARTYKPYELIHINSIEYLPKSAQHLEEEEEHLKNKTERKLEKLNKQAGVSAQNIIEGKREKKPTEKIESLREQAKHKEDPSTEEEFEVEKILDAQKGPTGKMLYLVQWKSYDDSHDSWEPYQNIRDTEAYQNWIKNRKKKK